MNLQQSQAKRETVLYPWETEVHYSSDEEYKQCLTLLFGTTYEKHQEIMENLFAHIVHDEQIHRLCKMAAEKWLLTSDTECGLILLCSYECLYHFHPILRIFFENLTKSLHGHVYGPVNDPGPVIDYGIEYALIVEHIKSGMGNKHIYK